MKDKFKILNWDSNFFGFKVAEIEENFLSQGNDQILQKLAQEEDVSLVYYSTHQPLKEIENSFYSFTLVNKRVPIFKKLSGKPSIHPKISFFQGSSPETELFEMVLRAGVYSRFRMDPNIPKEKSDELYRIWLIKSIEGKLASKVLVYREAGKIVGFATLVIEQPIGKAPLFAVSRKFEGKGVSFALMNAVDAVFLDHGCTCYESATQYENRPALKIFERHGFELKPLNYVYHLWKK